MKTSSYRALVETSSRLECVKLFDEIDNACINDATLLLNRIEPILDSVRRIELQECYVPVKNDPDFFTYHMADVQHLRNLSRAFRFASNIAAFTGEYEEVARNATVVLNLANAVRRGGLVVDHLVALAVARCGIGCLRTVREHLPNDVRLDLIAALIRYESERESFIDIAKRDATWESESGFEDKGCDFFEDNFLDPDSELSIEDQKALHQLIKVFADQPEPERQAMYHDQELHALAMPRLLTVDLAIRCWKDRNRCYPDSIADLSPKTLITVPYDPFSGRDFIYRTSGDSFMLYSTGPDKTDADAKFGPWFAGSASGYDLSLDSEDCWPICCTITAPTGFLRRLWSRLCFWRGTR